MTNTIVSVQLESLVDHWGLEAVLAELGEVCHAKADHILSNWQDAQSAGRWTRLAKSVERAEAAAKREGV